MLKRMDLLGAKRIYKIGILYDFPSNERIPYKKYKKAIKENNMKTYGFYMENELYGYIVTREIENIIFISYLAIRRKYRYSGYGSILLKELKEFFKNNEFIILEVDSKLGAKNKKELEVINRRNNFYLKNGFKKIENIEYSVYGVEYDLLIYKLNCKSISNSEILEIMEKFYKDIVDMRFFHTKVK